MKKAQEIINRIRKRDLYKFVDEAFLAPDFVMPSTSDIANCLV